jgi:hypothetical protein
MAQEKQEFRNATPGTIGVVVIQGGKEVALPLVSEATIWLSEDDQIATANAPARDEDNPFVSGALVAVGKPQGVRNRRPIGTPDNTTDDEATKRQREQAEAAARKKAADAKAAAEAQQKAEQERLAEGQKQAQAGGRPPQKQPPRQTQDETGAPPQPQGSPAQGSRAAGEEVGTPEAAAS